MTDTVHAARLTPSAFAPFGRVIDLQELRGRPVNEGRGERCDWPDDLCHATPASAPATAVYRLSASPLPFRMALVERHPLSDQLFIPLTGHAFLVAVTVGQPAGEVRAFIGRPGQAVLYRAGVWHLPLVALGAPGTFLMQMWETGDPARDCETREIAPLLVEAAADEAG